MSVYQQREHDEVDAALNRWRRSGFNTSLFSDEMRIRMIARLDAEATAARQRINALSIRHE